MAAGDAYARLLQRRRRPEGGVVGLERDMTTEAARRVALNSGGRIVATVSGGIRRVTWALAVQQSAADVVTDRGRHRRR